MKAKKVSYENYYKIMIKLFKKKAEYLTFYPPKSLYQGQLSRKVMAAVMSEEENKSYPWTQCLLVFGS